MFTARLVALLSLLAALPAVAAEALFPAPLHLTRQVHDPISGTTVVLDEYASGNRLISVRGPRTTIADYEKNELVEIDREQLTYSVTRFDAIARATRSTGPSAAGAVKNKVTSAGVRATKLQRNAEVFGAEIERDGATQSLEISVDRSVQLSREALEVLLGAAYPGIRTAEQEAVITAAAPAARSIATTAANAQPARAAATYALPVEQTTRYEMDGQPIEFKMSVLRVGSEPIPADLVAIPAGATRVTSRIVAIANELEFIADPLTPPKEH